MATEKCPPQSLLAYGQGFSCNVVIRDTDQARLSLLTDKLTKSKGGISGTHRNTAAPYGVLHGANKSLHFKL